jgi:hypothetical protein
LEILSRDGFECQEEAVVVGCGESGGEFLCCGEDECVSGGNGHFDVVRWEPSQSLHDAFSTRSGEPQSVAAVMVHRWAEVVTGFRMWCKRSSVFWSDVGEGFDAWWC